MRIFCIVMLSLLFISCSGKESGNILKIGISEEPETLNIWLASDKNSKKILSLIYQPLYIKEPKELQLIPWLAQSQPLYDPETLSYTVKLRDAKWSDGSELTAEDVVFTIDLIKQFKVPRYISKWNFVDKVEALDKRVVKFTLSEPKAVFITTSLGIPIVSKKEWSAFVEKALHNKQPYRALINQKIETPMGCGPFILKERRQGSYILFEKNRLFFGHNKIIQGNRLGPDVDNILFKIYRSADVAILSLKKGDIDYYWSGIQPGHLKNLEKNRDIKIFVSKKSALYYMGFNVRTPPFSDPYLRRAIATLVDKHFITSRIMQGFASEMDSIVPKGNEFWHSPGLPDYGSGLRREERIRSAYDQLVSRGYTWTTPPLNDRDEVVTPSTICMPGGREMKKCTILTPPAGYDPHRAACGTIIQEWLKDLGLPVVSRPMSFGALLDKVKTKHDFDMFILGYGKLALDPDYLRNFFYSANDTRRGWNMSGYNNRQFDKLAEASLAAMNREKRRELIWEMQKIISTDLPYLPLYNPKLIEAVNNTRFTGWVQTVGGIGNLWSLSTVHPIEKNSD